MTIANFDPCLQTILEFEGGWSDNPADPGGATMHGVTLAVFQHWFGAEMTKDDLRNITPDQEARVYRSGYWVPIHGDRLPAGVDLMVFDQSINSGPGRASKTLQSAAGVTADGIIGPATLAAVAAFPAPTLIEAIYNIREAFYRSLPTFDTFGDGWMSRLDRCLAISMQMTNQVIT